MMDMIQLNYVLRNKELHQDNETKDQRAGDDEGRAELEMMEQR
jgi:hypothetical protein